jgi:hypothetical protein
MLSASIQQWEHAFVSAVDSMLRSQIPAQIATDVTVGRSIDIIVISLLCCDQKRLRRNIGDITFAISTSPMSI